MDHLVAYDQSELAPQVFKLSLSEACEKYKDWMHHKNGAIFFGHLTLSIAIREAIIAAKPKAPKYLKIPDKFDSLDQMFEVFDEGSRHYWDYYERLLQNQCFVYCISPKLREYTVKLHAYRYSTAQVMDVLLLKEGGVGEQLTPLNIYAQNQELAKLCREYLSPRLNYLKKGNPRFPKKYDALWNEAQAAYIEEVKNIPLAHPSVRIAVTAEVYEKLYREFEALPEGELDQRGLGLAREMTQTMKVLNELTKNIDPPVA